MLGFMACEKDFICIIAFDLSWDKRPLFGPRSKPEIVFSMCHTVGNEIMKLTTPWEMVGAFGERLGVFMHKRTINGCWDVPNLYG